MEILSLLVFILACYGLSNMVVYSNGPWHVFKWWREKANKIGDKFGELFSCMMCFPSWVGGILSGINLFLIPQFSFTPMNMLFSSFIAGYSGSLAIVIILVIILLDSAIASGTSWLIHNIEEYFERGNQN